MIGRNFKVRNVHATIHFNNEKPGTLVVVTPSSYAIGQNPPEINRGVANVAFYSANVEFNGIAKAYVPYGSYNMTCWERKVCGGKWIYARAITQNITGGPIIPQTDIVAPACGDPQCL